VKALRLWLVVASTYVLARLVFESVTRGTLALGPVGWAQAVVVPVVETAALLVASAALRALLTRAS